MKTYFPVLLLSFLALLLLSANPLFTSPLFANPPATQPKQGKKDTGATIAKEVLQRMAEDSSTCAAYFYLKNDALTTSSTASPAAAQDKKRAKLAQQVLEVADSFHIQSFELSDERAARRRLEENLQSMKQTIGEDHSNHELLVNQYEEECSELYHSPHKRFAFWIQNIANRVIQKGR